ncbi:MAG TPA: glycosyltransferase family 39 protein [Methylomirabilota bacterium]
MRRSTLLLILIGAITFLAGLGRPAIGDSDEAFYAEAGREMVATGDWLTPHYNFEPRFQKPILFYWLVSWTYAAAGVGEAQARFWAGLAGIGLALVTAAAGRRWFDETTGLVAGAIVATSFGYFSIGRLSLPDLPLAFFITLATWAALVGPLDRPDRLVRWFSLAGFAAGAAFLTKGPVGLVVPVLAIAPAWWRERQSLRLPSGAVAAALAIMLAVGLPWYVAMTAEHGRTYLDSFFVGDNLERFATDRFNDPRPVWFYVPIVLGGMLPWTPLVAAGVPAARLALRRRRAPDAITWRLWAWALMPLALFTASIGKQPRYVLPVLPPLALLLARVLVERMRTSGDRRDPWMQWPAGVIAVLLAALAVLIYRARPLIAAVPTMFVVAAIVAISLAAVIVGGAAIARRSRLVVPAVTVAGVLLLGGLQYGLSPAGRDPVQDMATMVLEHRQGDEPIATFRVFVRNLVFYTRLPQRDLPSEQHVIDYLRSPDRVLCIIGADELQRVEAAGNLQVRRLASVLYFNASAVKLRTLLDPDQERDLERVLLVANH